MIRPTMKHLFAVLPFSLISTSAVRPLAAQQVPHVTIALVAKLADSAVATIVRAAGKDGRMIVLLRERDADAITLSSAMMAVFKARQVLGDTARSRLVIRVYGVRVPESLAPNERQLAEYYLGRLHVARLTTIDGVGLVKAVDVAMAPERTAPK